MAITGVSTAAVTNDLRPNGSPIVVDDYIALGARTCSGAGSLEVNVLAHETGHILGQPDYYDSSAGLLREQRRWVVGCWEIMSAGSWGCGTGAATTTVVPSHMGALPKQLFGWSNPILVNTVGIKPQTFTLRAASSTPDALRIRLTNTEALMVEYRPKAGFDIGLPAAGILVYHIESGRPFLPCQTCPRKYSYALLEADGDSALTRSEIQGGNRGAPGDAWGLTKFQIDDTTIPSTKLNNGESSFVRISKMVIDAAAGIARVTVSLLPAQITINRLVTALGMVPLPGADIALMDAAGNGNGRFDVGDFRAYLRIRADDP
jgi:immune inhibitor A